MTCVVMFDKHVIINIKYTRKSSNNYYCGKHIYSVWEHPENASFIFKWDNRLFMYDPTYSKNPEYLKNSYRETVLCMEIFDIFMDGLR